VVGPDWIDDWRSLLPVIETSVARNGGRSCINASTIVVPRHGAEIAHALASRLADREPKSLDDPEATLAAFASAERAEAIDAHLDRLLGEEGAVDVSGQVRGSARRVQLEGLSFLRPTVVLADKDHALAKAEFGFPFVSVVEVPTDEVAEWIGSSLVVAALTEDPTLLRGLMRAPHVDRLHTGVVPTTRIRWDQPHEGNLFEWLFRRRAVAGERFEVAQ
jgi:acyl-CoA reductase-like NAD-dependent aldehyde dehydrogenase